MQPQSVAKNIVLGSGYIYFSEEDANGDPTGFQYMAETPGFSLNITTEKTEIDSSDTPVAETLVSLVKKITRAGSLSVRDMSTETFERFIQGSASTVSQTATPVTAEPITVKQGRYYQLGQSTSNPSGVKGVTSVSVDTYAETTDFIVYADEGRIYIVPGGNIADDTTISVDYTPVANSRDRVASDGNGAKRGWLLFQPDNTAGENREVNIPRVELAANGDLPFKDRDNAMEGTFDLSILTRDGYEQVYVDGVPA